MSYSTYITRIDRDIAKVDSKLGPALERVAALQAEREQLALARKALAALNGEESDQPRGPYRTQRDLIIAYVGQNPGFTAAEIARGLGLEADNVRVQLNSLTAAHRLRKDPEKRYHPAGEFRPLRAPEGFATAA